VTMQRKQQRPGGFPDKSVLTSPAFTLIQYNGVHYNICPKGTLLYNINIIYKICIYVSTRYS
jgi:hypothetical protein